MTKITSNFTLEELVATSYKSLQDKPTAQTIINLTCLCCYILQPLRDSIQTPVTVTSGYRSVKLNRYVGGVADSKHLQGLAADLHINSKEHAKKIFDILKKNEHVDVCLFEHSKSAQWVHVQFSRSPRHIFDFNYIAK